MRLNRVRIGEKFVSDDRGGVWEKTGEDKGKLIFGRLADHGKEEQFAPDAFVYVIFDRPMVPRYGSPASGGGGGVHITLVDSMDGKILMEVPDASAAQVASIVSAEGIELKMPYKRQFREYLILDVVSRPQENALHVLLRDDGKEDKDEKGPSNAPENHPMPESKPVQENQTVPESKPVPESPVVSEQPVKEERPGEQNQDNGGLPGGEADSSAVPQ